MIALKLVECYGAKYVLAAVRTALATLREMAAANGGESDVTIGLRSRKIGNEPAVTRTCSRFG